MADLDLGDFVSYVRQRDPRAAAAFQRLVDAVNNTAAAAGVAPVGKLPAPPPVDAVKVKQVGPGQFHVQHTHNAEVRKGINYFTEISSSASGSVPIVIDQGASRTSHPFYLPATDDEGNVITYYPRGYAQYPGSDASPVTNGEPFTVGGVTSASLLSSTGSGTAAADGAQGGQGFGTVFRRTATGPKRG